jgi:hypothetical protein
MCDEKCENKLGINIQKVHETDVDGKNAFNIFNSNNYFNSIATLALGLRPKQRGDKVAGQEET